MTPPPVADTASSPGEGHGTVLPLPPRHPQRLVYLGTPEMAVPPLEALHDAGFDIALVITGADKRRARRAEPSATPVKLAAIALGIPVSHDVADAVKVDADLGVVVAYGRILRLPLLAALPMVNLHFSLLPRWRGAAPVERALMAGDERTGVCVMAVEEGLDTGGVYASAELAIRRTSTAPELGSQLSALGSRLLVDTLRSGLGPASPQAGEVTYAAKLTPADLRLDWARSAVELDRLVRVGGAWSKFRGRRLKVHRSRPLPDSTPEGGPGALHGDRVACGAGALQLLEVQPEGRSTTSFAAWANGARPLDGELLGVSVDA